MEESTTKARYARHYKRRRHEHFHSQQRSRRGNDKNVAAAASPCCTECSTDNPKYKCPKCRALYCSIACCRSHKEKCTTTTVKQQEEETVTKSKYLPNDMLIEDPLESAPAKKRRQAQRQDADDLDEGWKMTAEMKASMDTSEWLQTELRDTGLRQVILDVVSKSNRVIDNKSGRTEQEEALEAAKHRYPNFNVFLDKLLVVTGVLERQENDNVPMDKWLQLNGLRQEQELGALALKPIPQKPRPCWSFSSSSSSSNDDSSSSSSGENSDDSDSSTS